MILQPLNTFGYVAESCHPMPASHKDSFSCYLICILHKVGLVWCGYANVKKYYMIQTFEGVEMYNMIIIDVWFDGATPSFKYLI